MAQFLYRMSSWIVRRRRYVALGWIALIVLVAALAGAFAGATSDAFTLPGTESQHAIDLLNAKFPGSGGADARVVVAAPPGQTLANPRYEAAARTALAEVAKAPQVIAVTPLDQATVSRDQRIAFVDVHYAVSVDKVSKQAKAALQAATVPARSAGLDVEFSGGVISTTSPEGNNDLYGIIIAFVVLTITFGALAAAGMPLLVGILGVGTGLLGIKALSGVVSLNSTTPTSSPATSSQKSLRSSPFTPARTTTRTTR